MASNSLEEIKTGRGVTNPVASFSKFLDGFKTQLALALPAHLNADRMARLTLTAFSQSEQLQRCEPRTIVASLMVAGQMGLEIGVSGQGYLVPYKTTCTFVPGWQGIVDIVNRSGRATVWTGAVFDGDFFDYALGDSPFVKHKPIGEDDPDKITHVYAVGRVNGSDWPVIEVWPIKRVERHFKRNNKVGNNHYAFKHWEMYARKIPLLQVCKYMPKSIELTRAMSASYAADEGRTIEGDFVFTPADPETGEMTRTPRTDAITNVTASDSAQLLKEHLARIEKADKPDGLEMVLDEARDLLNDADKATFFAAYELKFPGK
jgi:recombination protein RecT